MSRDLTPADYCSEDSERHNSVAIPFFRALGIPRGFTPILSKETQLGDEVYIMGSHLGEPAAYGPHWVAEQGQFPAKAWLKNIKGQTFPVNTEELIVAPPQRVRLWKDQDGSIHADEKAAGEAATMFHPGDDLPGITQLHLFQTEGDALRFTSIWENWNASQPESVKQSSWFAVVLTNPNQENEAHEPEEIVHTALLTQGGGFLTETLNGELRIYGEVDPESDSIEDALESLICNCELDWISPSDTQDLTCAPMLGILGAESKENTGPYGAVKLGCWSERESETPMEHFSPIEMRWAYMNYQVSCPLEDLKANGYFKLQY